MANLHAGRSEQARRHRSLIDVIQDLEQENAAEVASSGVSPASDRPVPLDLSGAISDPLPATAKQQQHQQHQQQQHQQQQHQQQQHQQQQSPGLVSHRLQHSEDGSESLSCPPGATLTELPVIAESSECLSCLLGATQPVLVVNANWIACGIGKATLPEQHHSAWGSLLCSRSSHPRLGSCLVASKVCLHS